MNLCLPTIDVWTLEDEFAPAAFLGQLPTILQTGDVLAFGAYSPSARFRSSALALSATATDADSIYSTTFDLNRREHPNGRSFELLLTDATLAQLIAEAQRQDGQEDKPLFFDHFVAYRRGMPVVPLLCFHDAFSGGTLALSGLYSEQPVQAFAAGLPSSYSLQRNPENYPLVA